MRLRHSDVELSEFRVLRASSVRSPNPYSLWPDRRHKELTTQTSKAIPFLLALNSWAAAARSSNHQRICGKSFDSTMAFGGGLAAPFANRGATSVHHWASRAQYKSVPDA